MSLRSLLNDEPQDPISSLPPRVPSTPSTLSNLVNQPPTTPLRSPNPNPNGYGSVPFPSTKPDVPSQEYTRTHHTPSPAANRFLNGDATPAGLGEPSSVTKRSKKKSTRNAFHDGPAGNAPSYSNGYDIGVPPSMDIDYSGPVPNGSALVGENQKTGSTGRSNLTDRTSPRPRAYSSDLESPPHNQIWQPPLSRYMLKTRTKQHDIARIFHSHTTASNAVLSNNIKSTLAQRMVKIQQKERQERLARAAGRPYASLIVGGGGGLGSEGYGNSRAGSDMGDGYDEEDELRGDDFLDGVQGHGRGSTLAVPGSGRRGAGAWDASTAPSADEADTPFVSAAGRRDGRRRKALLDPDEGDNDSVAGGDGPSATGTPKRNKRRKVEVPKGGTAAASAGGPAGGLAKGTAGTNAKGVRKGARRSNRGRMIGGGIVGLEDWSVPYPDLGAPPPVLLAPEFDANGTGQPISFTLRSSHIKSESTSSTTRTAPITDQAYDAAFNPIWASIVSMGVPYAFKARANHVAGVKIVHERVSKWCTVAAKRGWGGDYAPPAPIRLTGKEKDAANALGGGRFGRDAQAKTKKLQRELLTFWKKNEKEERDERRRREKERVEKARAELEKKEEQRQRRKLEFLITQTELYSHFVGKRLQTSALEADDADGATAPDPVLAEAAAAVVDLEADVDDGLGDADNGVLDFDKDDPARLQALARRQARQRMLDIRQRADDFDQARREANAAAALLDLEGGGAPTSGPATAALDQAHQKMEEAGPGDTAKTSFSNLGAMDGSKMDLDKETGLKDLDSDELNFQNPAMLQNREMISQPDMLQATLKEYQLKGLNWLSGLYEQGINGILADEMGLGKTIQSIALLAHLAERQDIWGPFLIVSPASTLHNWQQELTRFVPGFKVVPYWGTVADRKTLRKFWAKKAIVYDRDAPFHIVVTSYNLIVTDSVYLKSLKWQYMILDEAQAIKSSSSARWNVLLDFSCRNRLLLTGTPIQNSMQELWALLHFIMPSLFDSHDEFSEWFSKDIEGAAGSSGGGFNEHQLRRLHMILKPFMLRRVKRNVQNELGEKIEIDLYCELTPRQRYLYKALRANSSVAELLRQAANFATDAAATASLMNLVMQFRKVCNHPELFERADVQAPFSFATFGGGANIMREGAFVEVPYSTQNPIPYSIPRLLYFDGGLLDVPSFDSGYGSSRKWLGCLMNIWTPDWINKRTEKGFAFLKLLNQTPSEVSRTYRSSLIERMLQSSAHNKLLRDNGPLLSDSALIAHDASPSEFLLTPRVTRFLRRAEGLPSLFEISLEAWNTTPLSRRQMQIYVEHAAAPPITMECRSVMFMEREARQREAPLENLAIYGLPPWTRENLQQVSRFSQMLPSIPPGGLVSSSPSVQLPAAQMHVPEPKRLIFDSGKLAMLDSLLMDLRSKGHRCLIYFQMTRMIDLMEEYMVFRQYKYLRLDGDTRLEDRRDMVIDWQQRDDIFCFLLSTRAGGLGINLTAADTVIFYECDWNPSNDAQAMDRAHRLGQTRQVTVYRLITRGTIDQRIVQMAGVKKDVQDIVVGNKPFVESHRPNEIVKLLLDDEELEVLQARGDTANLSVPPSGPASGMATPAGGRKPPVQVHGSWEAEDDGFFTGGRMQQVQQDEDIEFGGAGLGAVGSGMNTPGGFGTQTPAGPGGEALGPRGGKLRGRGRGRGRGRPPGIPNGEGRGRSRGRGGGAPGVKRGRGKGKPDM